MINIKETLAGGEPLLRFRGVLDPCRSASTDHRGLRSNANVCPPVCPLFGNRKWAQDQPSRACLPLRHFSLYFLVCVAIDYVVPKSSLKRP